MAQKQDTLPLKPVTWFLVADAKQACMYTRHKRERMVPIIGNTPQPVDPRIEHPLTPLKNMHWEAEATETYTSAHTGSLFETTSDFQEELRQQFAKLVATHLNQTLVGKEFDRLAIIAPAKMISDLKKHLSNNIKKHISEEISKDLTHHTMAELEDHLRDVH